MNQYTLYASPRSPFARRIRIALKRFQLEHEVVFLDVFQRNEQLMQANPLGLVPALITPADGVVTDSAMILEYLHEKTGAIWPSNFTERTYARQASTWCTGVMQYCVSFFLETSHHEVPSPSWAQEYENNLLETFDALSKLNDATWFFEGALTQAAFDLATAIEYTQFRLGHLGIGTVGGVREYPRLMSVFNECQKLGFFSETAPSIL